jgi:hypothetical protein
MEAERVVRTFEEESAFLHDIDSNCLGIREGLVPGMRVCFSAFFAFLAFRAGADALQVPGQIYVNASLRELLFDELHHQIDSAGVGGFLPAVLR